MAARTPATHASPARHAGRAPKPKTSSKRSHPAESAPAPAAAAPSLPAFRLTNADRVIDPVSGLSKGDLARYHAEVGSLMLPFLDRRPLALVRCPEGLPHPCFFQKQRTPGMPDCIHAAKDAKHSLLFVEDLTGILGLVQFGAIELHGWGSRLPDIDRPDWLVMDLDPDVGLSFHKVVDAAETARELFRSMGLESFVKTTGGKGLHVVVPIAPHLDFGAVKAFTHAVATAFTRSNPRGFTDVMSKAKRHGKIFLDYLRNGKGATAILPYSVRARENLPVALPVSWEDLSKIDPREFTAKTVPELLRRRKRDPWATLLGTRQDLRDAYRVAKKSA